MRRAGKISISRNLHLVRCSAKLPESQEHGTHAVGRHRCFLLGPEDAGWTSRREAHSGEIESLGVPGTIQRLPDDPIRDEHLRLRIEGFGVGTWDLDLTTQKLEWSDTAKSLFGVARDQPISYRLFLSL